MVGMGKLRKEVNPTMRHFPGKNFLSKTEFPSQIAASPADPAPGIFPKKNARLLRAGR
jgi:hypothetical protein